MSHDNISSDVPDAAVRIAYGLEPLQFGDLRLPRQPGPHPVVVVIHGGYWRARYDLSHMNDLCAALTAQSFATWNIEYGRIGDVDGGWPGTFLDVASATDHLRQLASVYKLDLERVLLLGFSAGGHLALWLAGAHRIPEGDPIKVGITVPILGVISLAGLADLRLAWELGLSNSAVVSLLGGTPAEVPQRYFSASPAELVPLGVRQILVHGSKDADVPFEVSQSYLDAALREADDVELLTMPNSGHFELVTPGTRECDAVIAAARRLAGLTH